MHGQWLVTLQGLPEAGRLWDVDVAKKLLEESEHGKVDALSGLCGDMHWCATIARQGRMYHLHGQWSGAFRRTCSRCNAAFDWQLSGRMERDFQMVDSLPREEDNESDCDFLAPPGVIDLLDVLREDVWLAWKADVICSDACKGLCPHCGADLNREACQCSGNDEDHPFAVLRRLKQGMKG